MNLLSFADIIAGFVPLDLQTQRDAQWTPLGPGQHLSVIFFKGTGTDGDDPVITLEQAQDAAGTAAKALNFTTIYRKQAADVQGVASFTETAQAAAETYTNSDAHEQLIWVIEIKGSSLDVAGGFDHVRVTLNDTGTNPQLGCVLYALQLRADITIAASSVSPGTVNKIEHGIAGEAIDAGEVLYQKASDGKFYLAVADDADTAKAIIKGVATNSAAANQTISYQVMGTINLGSVLTTGTAYILSKTPGKMQAMSNYGPDQTLSIVGSASSASAMMLNIVNTGIRSAA